jgi:hypothetical protein
MASRLEWLGELFRELEWFKEFVRVETDKFILVLLIVMFLKNHDPGHLDLVLGALIMAIQNNRYASRPQVTPPKNEGQNVSSKV